MISILWESDARIGEIGGMKIKDISFDDLGCQIMQESNMAARYVHLSGKQVDNAILRMHGLKKEDKQEDILKRQECARCKKQNDVNNEYCSKCWLPLTQGAISEIKETHEKDQNGMIAVMKLLELAGNNLNKVRKAITILQKDLNGSEENGHSVIHSVGQKQE